MKDAAQALADEQMSKVARDFSPACATVCLSGATIRSWLVTVARARLPRSRRDAVDMVDGLGTKQTHATLTMSTSASESSGRRDAIEADIAACCRKGFRVWEKNKIQQTSTPLCHTAVAAGSGLWKALISFSRSRTCCCQRNRCAVRLCAPCAGAPNAPRLVRAGCRSAIEVTLCVPCPEPTNGRFGVLMLFRRGQSRSFCGRRSGQANCRSNAPQIAPASLRDAEKSACLHAPW